MDSNGTDILVIHEKEVRQAEEVLRTLLADSQAKAALIISRRDGSLIHKEGETHALDTTSLAALAAAGFAATQEIARLVGEPEFSVLFHQGKQEHIYVCLSGEEAILMIIFDDRTTVGLVRVITKEAAQRLEKVFANAYRSVAT
jgi:predicted regulator of Ras-like GTPase activity (Roadblock/LC7/MglB family)